MVEHVHYIGSAYPVLELSLVDPDTGNTLDLSTLQNAVGNVQMEGDPVRTIQDRPLVASDPANGRYDFSFQVSDFTTPKKTGKAALWVEGDFDGDADKRFTSHPIEIEVREAGKWKKKIRIVGNQP